MIARPSSDLPTDLSAFVATHFAGRGSNPDRLIAESWYGSVHEHGLDPAQAAVHVQLEHHEIRLHQQEHHDFLAIASQGMEGLSRRLNPAGFAVLLSDRRGITLDARLPGQHSPYADSGLVIGSCWDESLVGTNGIGTGLAAGQPLIIHRDEHFLSSNAVLSCSVAPLFDPQGALMGCLNASCLNSGGPKQAQYLTLQLVSLYARLIENASFRQRYAHCAMLTLGGDAGDLGNERLLALDAAGRILGANRAAFLAAGHGNALLGEAVQDVLSMSLDELITLTHGGQRSASFRLAGGPALEVTLRMPAAPARRDRNERGLNVVPVEPTLEHLAGEDPGLQRSVQKLRRVLDRDIALLLTGETGTGKEAFARAIHQASARQRALRCAQLRGDPGIPDRKRAVRLSRRHLYRRQPSGHERQAGTGQRRDAIPRRDRRYAGASADAAAARAGRAGAGAAGRRNTGVVERAAGVRDASRPAHHGGCGRVS